MLWELFKNLKKSCPIYLEVMDEDEDSIPRNYVVLQEQTYDTSIANGDGICMVRQTTFDIRMYFKDKAKMNSVLKLYRDILVKNNIDFDQVGPQYDPTTEQTFIDISGNYIYGI